MDKYRFYSLPILSTITSLDRLSRKKEHIKRELQWFKDNGIRLKILDLPTSLVEVPEGQQRILDRKDTKYLV